MRIVLIVVLLVVLVLCILGFLAAGEPGVSASWRVGYALVGLGSFAGALWISKPRSTK